MQATENRNDAKNAIARFVGMDQGSKETAVENVNYLATAKKKTPNWKLLSAVPARGPMNTVLEAFKAETDIPLEIPFFTMMHLVSGHLMSKGVRINSAIGKIGPEIWTIVLADSGSGKSFTHNTIANNSPVQSTFPECASAAAFFEELEDERNILWFQDEFAQLLKDIEQRNSPMSQIKSYLLKTYDNSPIQRKTKKEEKRIEKPRLGILALNTPESFLNAISYESMLDGFAQRFSIVRAECDPDRHITNFPIYNVHRLGDAVKDAWTQIDKVHIYDEYSISDKAMEAFIRNFRIHFEEEVPKSFFRRIQFKNFKYALLYHILLGKNTSEIDEEDMNYAQRITTVHQSDMNSILLQKKEVNTLVDLVQKAKAVKERVEAKGRECEARDIQQALHRHIQGKEEASVLLDIVSKAPRKAPHDVRRLAFKKQDEYEQKGMVGLGG